MSTLFTTFVPYVEREASSTGQTSREVRFQSISSMSLYISYSADELRYADYQQAPGGKAGASKVAHPVACSSEAAVNPAVIAKQQSWSWSANNQPQQQPLNTQTSFASSQFKPETAMDTYSYTQGYSAGYSSGHAAGFDAGYAAGLAVADAARTAKTEAGKAVPSAPAAAPADLSNTFNMIPPMTGAGATAVSKPPDNTAARPAHLEGPGLLFDVTRLPPVQNPFNTTGQASAHPASSAGASTSAHPAHYGAASLFCKPHAA